MAICNVFECYCIFIAVLWHTNRQNGKTVRLIFKDIHFVEGLKNYCKIHTSNGVYITHGSMKQIEESFPGDEFIRIHKSTIISVYSIKYLTGQEVCLVGDRYFPIGETFRDKVKNFVSVRLLAFA